MDYRPGLHDDSLMLEECLITTPEMNARVTAETQLVPAKGTIGLGDACE